jgi:KipI family sensor histidine kinase inhibitor
MTHHTQANEVKFFPCGDCALQVRFGDAIDPALNDRVQALARSLQTRPIHGVRETLPAYCTLLILYDPCRVAYKKLLERVQKRLATLQTAPFSGGRGFVLPVCYGGVFGEDLPFVAQHSGLTAEKVIQLHTAREYRIYMLGFLPGFAYLGGLDEKLHTPRLENPREKIPAGAVGIGGAQTGVYPLASPGGWRLIGRTPVRPFDPRRAEPILYRAGDRIRFRAIDAQEYHDLEKRAERGAPTWQAES